jgi:hypothetical protein
LARHCGQRCGSLVSPFSAKKACSPAENTNDTLQSRHVKLLSVKLTALPSLGIRRRGPRWHHGTHRAPALQIGALVLVDELRRAV